MSRRLTLLVALALSACATTPKKGAVARCSDSVKTICLTIEQCSYDASRDCNVCQCESAFGPAPQGAPVSPLPRP